MTVGVPTCPPDAPLIDLIRTLLARNWEAIIVLEENGHAAGVVSRDDIVRFYGHDDYAHLTAEDIMRAEIPSAPPDIPLNAAAQIMQDMHSRVLFIVHHAGGIRYPAAWLTYQHLLRRMVNEDLEDLGIHAAREAPLNEFIHRRDAAWLELDKLLKDRAKGG
jgi:CBS domain-containing protein